ncbi:MAG: nucleotidyltransferase [Alphaproteobacteria bacterium]
MKRPEQQAFRNHDDVLEQIAGALDITDAQYELAVSRYKSIGDWLDRKSSTLALYSPEISPQGSFLLGTVIRPLSDADEFDLDLVCRVNASKSDFTQSALKAAVGREIIAYAAAKSFSEDPEDKRRCWTLTYQGDVNFHMDILPALPDADRYQTKMLLEGYVSLATSDALSGDALAITDDKDDNYNVLTEDWPVSNPFGFAAWFRERMSVRLFEAKASYRDREMVTASVEDVPDYKVRTPLQRAIQLLKRHRDTMFGDDEDRPISIIITTLSAHAYRNEDSVAEALKTILTTMDAYIDPEGSDARVPNPVDPSEDFADKWADTPRKEEQFWRWLRAARTDFGAYLNASRYDEMPDVLRKRLGERLVEGALAGLVSAALSAPAIAKSGSTISDDRLEEASSRIKSTGNVTKPWACE